MYTYEWDPETGGLLLQPKPAEFSKEPRPVYYQELDLLGFDKYWDYEKDDRYPYMWAEANSYYYRGNKVAQIKGGSLINPPELIILDINSNRNSLLACVAIAFVKHYCKRLIGPLRAPLFRSCK